MRGTSGFNVGEHEVKTVEKTKMGAGAPDLDQCFKSSKVNQIPCKAAFSGVLARGLL